MAHQERHLPAAASGETPLGLLAGFFPGAGEFAAFVAGLGVGALILGVLTAVAFAIHGQVGIWPTF